MFNYFNFKKFNDEYLITNDFGKWMFIDKKTLTSLVANRKCDDNIEQKLYNNLFLFDDKYEFSEKNKYLLRDAKCYLFEPTSLHIFVLTNSCNMRCIYCQAKDENYIKKRFMDIKTAEESVNFALQSPSKDLTFEFQGGEPLMNFETLKHIILYTEIHKKNKKIHYNLISNFTLLTDEIIDFLKEYNVNISTSLDGNKEVHNINRKLYNGLGSYDLLKENIIKIRKKCVNLNAIQTTTKYSFNYYKEIVNEYLELGFNSIFIRPLTKLGTATRIWNEIGYTAEEFVEFYSRTLDYIIELNLKGKDIKEVHAVIFLRKILSGYAGNYMELRSPCGASLGQLAYFYDGNIFTCDEGRMLYEMGDDSFKLGNVYENTYDDVVKSPECNATCVASLLESQLNCSDCVYQPYCGTCPVLNLAQDKDLFFKNKYSFRCKVYKGILDKIFLLLKNRECDSIFEKWID